MNIQLTEEQIKKYNDWKKSFGELPYIGATSGHFGLTIIFTSIGEIIKGKAWNGQEIDLTDYENW